MPNSDHVTPSAYDGSDVSIRWNLQSNSGNMFTPAYVQNGRTFMSPPTIGLLKSGVTVIFNMVTVVSIASSSVQCCLLSNK